MLIEWSALCSPEDPVLVVPWSDPARNVAFVDLRSNPYDFDAIPEAVQYPALLQALRALNAVRSPVFTAKCDVWDMHGVELQSLCLELDGEPQQACTGLASYIDLIWRDTAVFASSAQQQQRIARLIRQASALEQPSAMLDCVLRPALVDLDGPQEGYATSLYVKAIGMDKPDAIHTWGTALAAVVTLLRSRDFVR